MLLYLNLNISPILAGIVKRLTSGSHQAYEQSELRGARKGEEFLAERGLSVEEKIKLWN